MSRLRDFEPSILGALVMVVSLVLLAAPLVLGRLVMGLAKAQRRKDRAGLRPAPTGKRGKFKELRT